MKQNLNEKQLYQNHIFDIQQYQNAQVYEQLMFLIIELQSERKRNEYIQSINEKNIDFIEKKRLTSQKEINNQLIEQTNQVDQLQQDINKKNQTIFNQRQQINNLKEDKKNLQLGIDNFKQDIINQNQESTAINILNLENQRLQENLKYEKSQFEVQKIKLQKQNYELIIDNQHIKEQYKNLSDEYQKIRIHFENEQILSKRYQLQLAQQNTSDFKTKFKELKEKYDDLQNQNNILKDMISKNLSNRNHSIDKDFENIEELKEQIVQLKNENFQLKIDSFRSQTKKQSTSDNLMKPKKDKNMEFIAENLSVSQDRDENLYTPKSFYKMPTNPSKITIQYQDINDYLKEKQNDIQSLNNQDIQYEQKKIYSLKRLNDILRHTLKEDQNIQNQNQKLLNFIKDLKNVKDLDTNIEIQVLLQQKQKELEIITHKNQYFKDINNISVQQLQFLKNKNDMINNYDQQFSKVSSKTNNSVIKKPLNNEVHQQKEFIRRIVQNYKIEYQKFLELDKKNDIKITEQNEDELKLQQAFNEIDESYLLQEPIVNQFVDNFKKCQQQKNLYHDLFKIWIENENEIQQLQKQINQQELQLSMKENTYLEKNQKNLFKAPNLNHQSQSMNKLTRSLDKDEFQNQTQSKLKLHQTIGAGDKLNQVGSMEVSEQDPLEIFQNKTQRQQNVNQQNQQHVLNLEDSFFKKDQTKNQMDYSFSTKKDTNQDNNIFENSNRNNNDQVQTQQNENNFQANDLDQQSIGQQYDAKFIQTKNTEFFQGDNLSNYPSSKTNKLDPYNKYQTSEQMNNDINNLNLNQGSKRSYKSEYSRQFSNIGNISNKKKGILKQNTYQQRIISNQSQGLNYDNNNLDYMNNFNDSTNQQNPYKIQYQAQQNLDNQNQDNQNPYKMQYQAQQYLDNQNQDNQNPYQVQNQQTKNNLTEIESLKEQQRIQNQVLLGIMTNLQKSNIEIDKLPQVINDIVKENYKLKNDIKLVDTQQKEFQVQIQNLQREKDNLLENLTQQNFNNKQLQNDQQNQLKNYQDVFSLTKVSSIKKLNQQAQTQQIVQENKEFSNHYSQNKLNSFSQQTNNLSRVQKVQVTQLLEENDYLLQKVQSERKKNFQLHGQDKINSLEDLLAQCEEQLTKLKEKNISLQNQLQQELNNKKEIENLYTEQISKKNTEIIALNNQIQLYENKFKSYKENQTISISKNQNQDIEYELLIEKNERLEKKIKTIQQQMIGSSVSTIYKGRNMDYYINLISKLKQENKELKQYNMEMEKIKRDNLYLKSQLEIYKDTNDNTKITTYISSQNNTRQIQKDDLKFD